MFISDSALLTCLYVKNIQLSAKVFRAWNKHKNEISSQLDHSLWKSNKQSDSCMWKYPPHILIQGQMHWLQWNFAFSQNPCSEDFCSGVPVKITALVWNKDKFCTLQLYTHYFRPQFAVFFQTDPNVAQDYACMHACKGLIEWQNTAIKKHCTYRYSLLIEVSNIARIW